MVFSGGTLEIGTSSTPIANNVTAEVIIRDIPLDSNPGGIDPKRLLRTITSLKDRKSTRLNSSHQIISYAVFCLKKKKTSLRRRQKSRSEASRCTRTIHKRC